MFYTFVLFCRMCTRVSTYTHNPCKYRKNIFILQINVGFVCSIVWVREVRWVLWVLWVEWGGIFANLSIPFLK